MHGYRPTSERCKTPRSALRKNILCFADHESKEGAIISASNLAQ
jgi:hypothetical protein